METGSQQSQSASQDWNILLSPSSELSIDSQCPVRAVTARLEAPSEKQALAMGSYRGKDLRNPQLTQFINGVARFWKAQNCEESLEMLSMTEQDPGRVTQRGRRAEKYKARLLLPWSKLSFLWCFLLVPFFRNDVAVPKETTDVLH